MSLEAYRAAVRSVICPLCNAQADEPCREPGEVRMTADDGRTSEPTARDTMISRAPFTGETPCPHGRTVAHPYPNTATGNGWGWVMDRCEPGGRS